MNEPWMNPGLFFVLCKWTFMPFGLLTTRTYEWINGKLDVEIVKWTNLVSSSSID
jgi:hypothetical protein